MSILDNLQNPTELKELSIDQLCQLSQEVRENIIATIKENGGHLSSNLGIVETTVALHQCFDFPKDKIIFDVGHQCYTHKLLTKREKDFSSIRTWGGLSGFPDIEESVYDCFSTGHAGTSISAGLGLCAARNALGQDYCVVNVVGDGSLANGLNLEALHASNEKPKNYILILNDNGMSISKNKNGFYKLISKGTTKKGYTKSKRAVKLIFGNSFITKFLRKVREFVKRIFNSYNYFEKIGFKYVGVIDGNDLKELTNILPRLKEASKQKAIFLHIKTTKGKGYRDAEENSSDYHGVSKNFEQCAGGFGITLGKTLNTLIEKDSSIVAITAAMKDGTGLKEVESQFPKNFFDVGIAEEYAVTMAAGMAMGGLKPVVAIYSTFLQRAYDQILHDVCMQNLPVVFCLDRAGLCGEDGKTHQGVFDISFLCHMPNMTILTPADEQDLQGALEYALSLNSPVAIRYPKQQSKALELSTFDGKWERITQGDKATVLAVGPRMISLALELNEVCEKNLSVVCVRSVKPLDKEFLSTISGKVITLEENALIGGFGQMVKEYFTSNTQVSVYSYGIQDKFIPHGKVEEQLDYCGLNEQTIKQIIS